MYHSKPFGESTLYTVISPFKTTIVNGFKWCINLYEKGTKSRVKWYFYHQLKVGYRNGYSKATKLYNFNVKLTKCKTDDFIKARKTKTKSPVSGHRTSSQSVQRGTFFFPNREICATNIRWDQIFHNTKYGGQERPHKSGKRSYPYSVWEKVV